MDHLGLTTRQLHAYNHGLVNTHERRIELQILNLEGQLLSSVNAKFLDGQVMVDVDQTPSRTADIRILDPDRTLNFEPDSPGDAPLHRSRMMRVIDSRRIPGIGDTEHGDLVALQTVAGGYGRTPYGTTPYGLDPITLPDPGLTAAAESSWVDCEVITGVIWDFERNGAEVSLVLHGKEEQMMGAKWSPRTFGAKTRKTNAIRELARGTGERSLSIPDLRATFPKRFTVARLDPVWPKVKRVAHSLNRRLFYDGRGRLNLTPYSTQPVYTFHAGLLSEVQVKRNVEGMFNVTEVVGGNPKGPKKKVSSGAFALPAAHPLSPVRLGRNGDPLRLVNHVENGHLKTKADCVRVALRLRDDGAKTVVDFELESLPVPHLQEYDMVAAETENGRILFRMRQWSIPLGPDAQPMTVGSIKRTVGPRRRHR